MAIKTLYSVLGVEPSDPIEEIDAVFNRLKAEHPAAKLNADEDARMRFLAIQQAYQTLSNPDARAQYDKKLARVGIKVAPANSGGGENPGLLSMRNFVLAGVILILISGTWFYQAREKARAERELAVQTLRLAEEEKRRRAEIQASEEARRQAAFDAAAEQRARNEERQFRLESERAARQVSSNLRSADRQTEYQRQREQTVRAQQERQQQTQAQYQQQQAERAAQQSIQNDKNKLREVCMQRYNRPDC